MEVNKQDYRLSKSGFSIKTGWGEGCRIIASCPFTVKQIQERPELFSTWINDAEKIINSINTRASGWVSVEKLPTNNMTVPVLVDRQGVLATYYATYNKKFGWLNIRGYDFRSIHDSFIPYIKYYLPLPKPPTGDE